ncbi:unnamed protein product [Owenia fusiformis]|uniref:DH domain-containing protein n=1 Tax=Owenia fusiformis TaxID=6347 RepID=A0A8S4MXK5_OWEFU|nr:unnamed protein product [Owenia fusiformis]
MSGKNKGAINSWIMSLGSTTDIIPQVVKIDSPTLRRNSWSAAAKSVESLQSSGSYDTGSDGGSDHGEPSTSVYISKSMLNVEPPTIIITDEDDAISLDDKDEEIQLCQNRACSIKGPAMKICHHSDCQDKNNHKPLMLCADCDATIHKTPSNEGHLRFDLHPKAFANGYGRKVSSRSLPDQATSENENEDENENVIEDDGTDGCAEDTEGVPNGGDEPKDEQHEQIVPEKDASEQTGPVEQEFTVKQDAPDLFSSPSRESYSKNKAAKIKRKKVIKRERTDRRYHTDNNIGKDCFTVRMELWDQAELELVNAKEGVTLRDALVPIFEKRKINLDAVNVYLQSSNTPLPLIVDTFPFGGSQLIVKAKEGSDPFAKPKPAQKPKTVAKTPSSSIGRKKGALVLEDMTNTEISSSPHGTLTGADLKQLNRPRSQSKFMTSLFSPFVKDKEKQEALADYLNGYSSHGFPEMPALLTMGKPMFDASLLDIEEHWSQVVDDNEGLSKKEKDQQEALWELLHTETEYIKKVQVIADLFLCCLLDLQNQSVLNEIETEKLFNNISDVVTANCLFWESYIFKMLQEARSSRTPLKPTMLKEAFEKFEELFHPYTKYCLDQQSCVEYMKSRYSENDVFKTFVMWAESQSQCNRLKLTDLLVMPMQRLTKYSLLLNAILKKTDDKEDQDDLIDMIENVNTFVSHVNLTIRHVQEQERLAALISRIESYEAVDLNSEECVKLIGEYTKLDLTCPLPGCSPELKRNLLIEGPLKLKDAYSRNDVYCFLFTDMFLITKPVSRKTNLSSSKVRVIKAPMRLDRIAIRELRDGVSFLLVYLSDYDVAEKAYTFHGEPVKLWIDHIRKAQESYKEARKAMTTRASKLSYLQIESDAINGDYPSSAILDNTHKAVSRQESDSSDKFLPNIASRSSSTDLVEDAENTENLEVIVEEMRPRSATFSAAHHVNDTDAISRNKSCPDHALINSINGSPSESPRTSPRDNSPRVATSPVQPTDTTQEGGVVKPVPTIIAQQAITRTDSQSSNESSGTSPDYPPPAYNTVTHNNMDFVSEDIRSKLNQRRSSRGEKRYHTADAIQDMNKKDRDASIHKRLSWNFGNTVDINIEDGNGKLKGKAYSSESLRSVRSSSGISSTSSLINEENEDDFLPTDDNHHYFEDGDILNGIKTSRSDSNINEHLHTNSDKLTSHSASDLLRNTSASSLTNSTSDSSETNTSSETLTNITSTDTSVTPSRRKLTHAELIRMKKQLLLNATLEASDV